MKKIIKIFDKKGDLLNEFTISLFQRKTNEFQLDPKTFYLEYAKNIHEETVEIKIDESDPFTVQSLIDNNTHVHKGNDGNQYICYPPQIKSMEEAIELAKNWCLITTFHMKEKADSAWFESFGYWLIEKTKSGETPIPFEEFPLWIQNGYLGWRVEIN